MDDTTLEALRTAASALFDIGFATMIGALATPAMLHDATSAWASRSIRRCRRLFLRASLAALGGSLAWMAAQTLGIADAALGHPLDAVRDVVAGTSFGHAWAVATAAIASAAAMSALRLRRPAPSLPLALLVVLAAVAHATMGHAGANGFGWQLPTMAVHLLAIGLWTGGVIVGAGVLARDDADAVDGVRYAARLSRLASAALAAVAVTGAASAWHGLGGSLAPLAPSGGSSWGLVLDAKLALVASAVALGGFNRFAVMPSLPTAWRRFARVLRVESLMLLAALLAAAMLSNGEPPAV